MTLTTADLWKAACEAAQAAAHAENMRLPPESKRGFDCGFAWVVIKPAKGPFVAWLKSNGIGSTRDYGGGGFQIWYSSLHNIPTQSIGVHEAAARAACDVLKANGVLASWSSRLD